MPMFWLDVVLLLLLLFPTTLELALLVELRLTLFPNKFAFIALGVCGDPVLVYCHGGVLLGIVLVDVVLFSKYMARTAVCLHAFRRIVLVSPFEIVVVIILQFSFLRRFQHINYLSTKIGK